MEKIKKQIDKAINNADRTVDNEHKLDLHCCSIKRNGLKYLISKIQESHLKIKQLSLYQCNIGNEGCQQFQHPALSDISSLEIGTFLVILDSNRIEEYGCRILSRIKWDNLQRINLTYNYIGSKGFQIIFQAKWSYTLRHLCMDHNCIEDQGMTAFKDKKIPNLEQLSLDKNLLTSEGIYSLSKAEIPNLKYLCLNNNNISNDGCLATLGIHMPKLESLYLNNNQINHEGAYSLSKGNWPNLTFLSLGQNPIGDRGCKYIKNAKWRQLQDIHLNQTDIGDGGIVWISKANWPNLKNISLRLYLINGNIFRPNGMKAFSSNAHFPKMFYLSLASNSCQGQLNKQLIKCYFPDMKRYYIYPFNWKSKQARFWDQQFENAFPKER